MQRDPTTRGPARSMRGAATAAARETVAKRRPRAVHAMPEVAIAGRRDVPGGGTWTVECGAAARRSTRPSSVAWSARMR